MAESGPSAEARRQLPGCPGLSTGNLDLAAHIAHRVSMRRRFAYAVATYAVSLRAHWNDPMDLEPGRFPYAHRSEDPTDQVRFAYAIQAAYAVVEQLGLVPEKDSFPNGKWVPEKRQRLEERLRAANVDLADRALWHLRGGKTKLEMKRPPQIRDRCPWSFGNVRDCEVDVVDAIADVRWMRSNIAAHDVKTLARCLSIHDVANSQLLARRLILDAAGCHSRWMKEIEAQRRLRRKGIRPLKINGKNSGFAVTTTFSRPRPPNEPPVL